MIRQLLVATACTLVLSACGGGGGVPGATAQLSADRLDVRANLATAEYLALGSSVANSTAVAQAAPRSWLAKLVDWVVPSAYANARKSTNLLAFTADGTPIANPLTAAVDFIIGGLTIDPTGQFIYLGIEDHQNSWNPEWADLPSPLCSLYKITKATGAVQCLSDSDTYSPYSPVGNQFAAGNATESFIKFDARGNGYFIAFDGTPATADVVEAGTNSQRLIKLSPEGKLSTHKDPSGWYARNLAYGPQGKLYYSEVAVGEGAAQMRSYFFDPMTDSYELMPGAGNDFWAHVIATLEGDLYVSDGSSLSRWNTADGSFDPVLSSNHSMVWLQRDPYGGANVLRDDGGVYRVEAGEVRQVGQIGTLLKSEYKINASDIIYPKIGAGLEHVVAVGSTDTGRHQVCVWSRRTWAQHCQTLDKPQAALLAVTAVGDRAMMFWNDGGNYLQTEFNMTNFAAGQELAGFAPSQYADGSVLAAVTTRPPLAFKAEMETVHASATSETVAAHYLVEDSYTWLKFLPSAGASLSGLNPEAIQLVDTQNQQSVAAQLEVLEGAVAVHVLDNLRISGYADLASASPTDYALGGTGTTVWQVPEMVQETNLFSVARDITVFRVQFDATARELDLSSLRVTDANDQAQAVAIQLVNGGDTLEIKAKDSGLAPDQQPYRQLPAGTTWTLHLPERLRLPAQVFLSPFERTQVSLVVAAD